MPEPLLEEISMMLKNEKHEIYQVHCELVSVPLQCSDEAFF